MIYKNFLCCGNRKYSNKKVIYKKRPINETDFGLKKYYKYYKKCLSCDHYSSFLNFNLDDLYNQEYSKKTYGSVNRIRKKFNYINSLDEKHSDNKQRVERCFSFLKKKNLKGLDIGCGLGVFPYYTKKKYNLNMCVIEKDIFLKKHLKILFKKNFIGRNIFNKSLTNNFFEHFDFISLNKILEHLYEPQKFLETSLLFLKRGGLAYIEVPDQKALKINGKFTEEFFIEHLHVFSKQSFKFLLKNLKLKINEIKSIKEPSGKFTIYAFCQKL